MSESRGGPIPLSAKGAVYVCDVEGNWEYFCRVVALSEGVSFTDGSDGLGATGPADMVLEDGYHFVFGGDAGDKGNGSLRFTGTMVRLFDKYGPSRVTLLVGNRDANKLRLTSELAPSEMNALPSLPGPYWVAENKRVSPMQFVQQQAAAAAGGKEIEALRPSEIGAHNTVANRIRWMLKETMGSAGDFERRREELVLMGGGEAVSESAVCDSFAASVAKGGCIREFLERGVLARVVGNTLFVHGGVIGDYSSDRQPEAKGTDCFGYVPDRPTRHTDVRAWVAELNAWYDAQILDWIARPLWDAGSTPSLNRACRGGDRLIDYVVPTCEPSVVMGRHLTRKGMPNTVPAAIAEALVEQGIQRILLGHTPHGNSPTVAKSTSGLMVVMSDTSYSDMKAPDNRGAAACLTHVLDASCTRVHGRIEDGTEIDYTLSLRTMLSGEGDDLVGDIQPEGNEYRMFVKGRLRDGRFLLCHVEGFKVDYRIVTEEHVQKTFAPESREATLKRSFSLTTAILADHRSLDEDYEKALKEIFQQMDRNKDGTIDLAEFRDALAKNADFSKLVHLQTDLKDANSKTDELFAHIDTNSNRNIEWDEFLAFFIKQRSGKAQLGGTRAAAAGGEAHSPTALALALGTIGSTVAATTGMVPQSLGLGITAVCCVALAFTYFKQTAGKAKSD